MSEININHYHKHIVPLIEACEKKECIDYWLAIWRFLSEEIEDVSKKETLILFRNTFSYLFVPSSPGEPFAPIMTLVDGSRSAIPDDLDEKQKEFLEKILPRIEDAEARARVADTLWTLKYGAKPYEHAKTAIEAYLVSADTLLEKGWHYTQERLERAFRIDKQLGMNSSQVSPEHDVMGKIFHYIETEKSEEENRYFLPMSLIKLLIEEKCADKKRHPVILEEIAVKIEKQGDHHNAREAWSLKAKIHTQTGEEEEAKRYQIRVAETYVTLANNEEKKDRPSYMIIEHWLRDAAEAYKYISGEKERGDEIYKRLCEVQKFIPEEMKTASFKVDISDVVNKAKASVSGHDLFGALLRFASLARPPSYEEIKQTQEKLARDNFIHEFFSCTHYNSEGAVISTSSPDDSQETKMHRHMVPLRDYYVHARFLPALQKIKEEHHVSPPLEWGHLLENHPFIPPDRIDIYSRGLNYGFNGDFSTAALILVPQIENSLRYILKNCNHLTSKLNNDGTQEERTLKPILENEGLVEILGKDLVFDLQGLLIRKEGSNLRNDIAHGLLNDSELSSPKVVYLYWLALHIIFCFPVDKNTHNPEQQDANKNV